MKLDLDAIEKRCEKSTPGPWIETMCRSYQELSDGKQMTVFGQGPVHKERDLDKAITDMEFISHARADIPALLQFAKEAKAALEFYGDKENWATDDLCRETGNKTFDIILFDFDRNYSRGKDLAGRKARELLTKYFGDE